jgi:hypothetical protein
MRRRFVALVLVLVGAAASVATATPAHGVKQIDLCDYFRNMLICGDLP